MYIDDGSLHVFICLRKSRRRSYLLPRISSATCAERRLRDVQRLIFGAAAYLWCCCLSLELLLLIFGARGESEARTVCAPCGDLDQ